EIIENGGILVENGMILKTGIFNDLKNEFSDAEIEEIEGNQVLLPGFVDSHRNICFGGNRSKDFAMRLNGKTYMEIAESGGGIWSTVTNTRKESKENLIQSTLKKVNHSLQNGTTTTEIKSGYGLSIQDQLKMLEAINEVKSQL